MCRYDGYEDEAEDCRLVRFSTLRSALQCIVLYYNLISANSGIQ